VEGGGKTSAPAVTRRKDIGRITVRPISFQRDQRDRRDPTDCEAIEEAHRPPRGKRSPETEINHINELIFFTKTPKTLDLWN